MIPAETSLLGLLRQAGLLLGRVAAVLGPLAASAAPEAVGATAGPLGGLTTSERTHSGHGAVGLLLAAFEILGGCSEDVKGSFLCTIS